MQQTTCPNLLTVVNSLYINDITGANPRLFQPQSQFTYKSKILPASGGESCENACGIGFVLIAYGPGDFTDELPEVHHLQFDAGIMDLCTGIVTPIGGTIKINNNTYALGEEFYELETGLNQVDVTIIIGGVQLKHRSFLFKDESGSVPVTEFIQISQDDDFEGTPFPLIGFGSDGKFFPGDNSEKSAEVILQFGQVTVLKRTEYEYAGDGNYIQRYSITGTLGTSFIEILQAVENCPTKCCNPQTKYVVECNGHEYHLPGDDVVETLVVIDPQHRDFEKDRNEYILQPNSGEEPPVTFKPNPDEITRRANTVYM